MSKEETFNMRCWACRGTVPANKNEEYVDCPECGANNEVNEEFDINNEVELEGGRLRRLLDKGEVWNI